MLLPMITCTEGTAIETNLVILEPGDPGWDHARRAFDLAERSVRRSENLSLLLLVLNAIRWLAPPDPALPVQVDVGERYRDTLAAPAAVTVEAPDGTSRTWPARTEIAVDVERRGVCVLRVGGRSRVRRASGERCAPPQLRRGVGRRGVVG